MPSPSFVLSSTHRSRHDVHVSRSSNGCLSSADFPLDGLVSRCTYGLLALLRDESPQQHSKSSVTRTVAWRWDKIGGPPSSRVVANGFQYCAA